MQFSLSNSVAKTNSTILPKNHLQLTSIMRFTQTSEHNYFPLFLLFALALLFQSCEDLFEAHPYDGKVTGETGINSKNIALIEKKCENKDTIRFALMGDTHRWYTETEKLIDAINARTDVDFVIHGGDITDFGATKEFLKQRDIMNKLRLPYVVLLGNHDCLGNGELVYRRVLGIENFSFMVSNIKFVCLNTNALEYSYSRPIPDFEFIEQEIKTSTPNHERTIVVMHAKPYSEQFNNNIAQVFHKSLKLFPNLLCCLHGHDHNIKNADIFKDNIKYLGYASAEKRNFLLFTITPDNYTYEIIDF